MRIEEHADKATVALQQGWWEDARVGFEASLAQQETAEALDGLAQVHWWLCDARASIRYRERAWVLFRRAGDAERAGRAAIDLSISYLVNLGNDAAAHGWLAPRVPHMDIGQFLDENASRKEFRRPTSKFFSCGEITAMGFRSPERGEGAGGTAGGGRVLSPTGDGRDHRSALSSA